MTAAHVDPATRWRPVDEVIEARIDGETVLYLPATGSLHHLDGVASMVWSGLAADVTVGGLCSDLAGRFAASMDTVHVDVSNLLTSLLSQGLICARSDSSGP